MNNHQDLVEQNTLKRRGVGLRAYDTDRACPGFTLFAPHFKQNRASFGRLFEVTRDGEIVWEYVNPYFGGPPNAETNEIFRAYRYSPEEIAAARS